MRETMNERKTMTPKLLDECTAGTFAGRAAFPEIVGKMTADGVEWYSANLIMGMTTHYGADLNHHQTRWPEWERPEIGERFSGEKVVAAIRASQRGESVYREFLRRIAEAGVVYYTVHLTGRKAVYFGRHGESHAEPFPQV